MILASKHPVLRIEKSIQMDMIMVMRRLFSASCIPLAILLASCRPDEPKQTPKVHGELIAGISEPATNAPAKRKHPKPPSVQRRMVLAQAVALDPSNVDSASMPSGTLGTAADLAKTNLPSISSLAGPQADLPGYENVSFSTLSGFDFSLTKEMVDGTATPAETAASARSQIPPTVQSLNGKDVTIQGFLLPVTMNNGLAVEFLLMRNQSMCCYGVPPKINEWITVNITGPGVKPVMDQPITVAGTLRVGPIEENGSLAGIYHLDARKVVAPF